MQEKKLYKLLFQPIILIIYSVVLMFSLISCESNEEFYIRSLREFVTDAELNSDEFSEEQWERQMIKFSELKLDYKQLQKKGNLTVKEKKEIELLIARFEDLAIKEDPVGNIMDILFD